MGKRRESGAGIPREMQAEQLTTLSQNTHIHLHALGEIGNPHRDIVATITNNLTQVKRAHKLLQIDKGVKGKKEKGHFAENTERESKRASVPESA